MNYKPNSKWDLLSGEPADLSDDDLELMSMVAENLKDLTSGIQRGR
jgi:hypothetical protein